MALITRSSNASLDPISGQFAAQIPDLIAGEAIDIAAPCYIKSSDGKVYMTNATAKNEAAEVVGFSARAAAIGQPVTLVGKGARFQYGTALTPGNVLYAGTTKGRLDSVPQLGDPVGVAQVITATDIRVIRDVGGALQRNLKIGLVAGGAAGDHTLTGIALGDEIIFVGHFTTAAAIATLADLTSEFSVTAADTISNAGGTDTTNDQLMVLYYENS